MMAPTSGTLPSAVKNAFAASGERCRTCALVANAALQAGIQRKAIAGQTNGGLQGSCFRRQFAVLARQDIRMPQARPELPTPDPPDRRVVDGVAGLVQVHVARCGARAPSRAHRPWFRSRPPDDAANRSRRRPDPNSWVRPPPTPRTPPPRRRRHCRRRREFPGPPGSRADRRSQWRPCAQPRCVAHARAERGGRRNESANAAMPRDRGIRNRPKLAACGAVRKMAIKACDAASARSRRSDARTRTHCRRAPQFRAPGSRK